MVFIVRYPSGLGNRHFDLTKQVHHLLWLILLAPSHTLSLSSSLLSTGTFQAGQTRSAASETGSLKRIGVGVDVTEHKLLPRELRRREAYLAEAQRLSHTGSFGWRPGSGEHVWSDETYRIFEYDPATTVTLDMIERVHPEDRNWCLNS